MAPTAALIPLIAATVSAAGGIASSAISAKAAAKQSAKTPANSLLSDLPTKPTAPMGVLPMTTSPLGDTSTASLTRGKLLGV